LLEDKPMKTALRPLLLLALLNFIFSAGAEISATNEPLPGIFIHSETRTNPPTRLFVAEIDLANPKIHLRVAPGGPDPDGDGKWETTLMEPTKIAGRENFDFVINGDFFDARAVKDAEGTNSGYHAGQWALTVGSAMTDGKTWSASAAARPCFVVRTNQTVAIEMLARPAADDREVIGGNVILVKDGAVLSHTNQVRHPRTAIGFDAAKTNLVIMVVDGRKPGVAIGMSYDELAQEMLRLGCSEALNLDGGGSSVMAVREVATGQMKILNAPTDGHERAVADVLGISVDKP
jgi:exopolysaccharide biosynthesis protein